MKVYVATLVDLENTLIVGVYTSEDTAMGKLEKAMDDLMDRNEDYGVYSEIVEKYIDDMSEEDFT